MATSQQHQSRVTDFFQHKKNASTGSLTKASDASAQRNIKQLYGRLQSDDFKKKIGKVRNLDELRERLGRFSQAAARLNVARDQGQLKIQAIERSAQECSPRKSNVRIEPTSDNDSPFIPSHERYAHLVSSTSNLEMPSKYKMLSDTFRACDQIVSIMYNRNEMITFDKLKGGVQQMTHRNFEQTHLGQIKCVYGEAYKYEQLKLTSKFSATDDRLDRYHLTITPDMENDLKKYEITTPCATPVKRRLNLDSDDGTPPSSPTKNRLLALSPCRTPTKFNSSKEVKKKAMSGARLICRSEIFRKNLLGRLYDEYRKFLASLTPSIVLTAEEESRIVRWHADFALEALPDIPASELPQIPVGDKVYTAKEMLQQNAAKRRNLPRKLEDALKMVAAKDVSTETNCKINQNLREKFLAGIPPNVLEKVRAKEAQRQQRLMNLNVEEELRRQRLSRLPDLIKIIKRYFDVEKKNVLPFDTVVRKVKDSYCRSIMSLSEIEIHLSMIIDMSSNWLIRYHLANKGTYLRIDRTIDTSQISHKIESTTKQLID